MIVPSARTPGSFSTRGAWTTLYVADIVFPIVGRDPELDMIFGSDGGSCSGAGCPPQAASPTARVGGPPIERNSRAHARALRERKLVAFLSDAYPDQEFRIEGDLLYIRDR